MNAISTEPPASDLNDIVANRLLSVAEVCRLTSRGKTWIMERVKREQFPAPAKISGRLFWSNAEIQDWIAEQLATRKG